MEMPQVRAGQVSSAPASRRIVAYFYNSAPANLAIQVLTQFGVPNDQLGVTPPERIETGQGMILSIPCTDEKMVTRIESLCRELGAEIHRQRL
jgi:hypothetical protein